VQTTATETLLRRDRAVVIGGLAVIVALAWYYVLTGAGTGMPYRQEHLAVRA
jgi:predicted metal-binding membrane protein